jgi:hypothetical protein
LGWSLGILLAEWVIRIVMLFVVIRRRRPAAAMAWLLVIFFQPWVGIVLYALIGRNRLTRMMASEDRPVIENAVCGKDAGVLR